VLGDHPIHDDSIVERISIAERGGAVENQVANPPQVDNLPYI